MLCTQYIIRISSIETSKNCQFQYWFPTYCPLGDITWAHIICSICSDIFRANIERSGFRDSMGFWWRSSSWKRTFWSSSLNWRSQCQHLRSQWQNLLELRVANRHGPPKIGTSMPHFHQFQKLVVESPRGRMLKASCQSYPTMHESDFQGVEYHGSNSSTPWVWRFCHPALSGPSRHWSDVLLWRDSGDQPLNRQPHLPRTPWGETTSPLLFLHLNGMKPVTDFQQQFQKVEQREVLWWKHVKKTTQSTWQIDWGHISYLSHELQLCESIFGIPASRHGWIVKPPSV